MKPDNHRTKEHLEGTRFLHLLGVGCEHKVLPVNVGTLQAGARALWLYSLRDSEVTWYWVSVSWPAYMAG
jgi:hypothetical protein